MASISQLSAGKPVYGSGSYAPTRGPVSAAGSMGYVQREMQKNAVSKTGNDGQSDSRSGLAAAALSRSAVNAAPAAVTQKTSTTPAASAPKTTLQSNAPAAPSAPAAAVASAPQTSAPTGTPATDVQVNSLGQLQLPYSANWGAEVLAALEQGNADILQMQLDSQKESQQFADDSRNLDKMYASDQASDSNISAARGLTKTSAYAKEITDSASEYSNQKNSLTSNHGLFQQGLISKRNQIQSNFDRTLSKGALSLADEQAQQAGSLGLDQAGKVNTHATPATPATPAKTGGTVKTATAANPAGTAHPVKITSSSKAAQAAAGGRLAAAKDAGKTHVKIMNNRSLASVAKELGVSIKALKAANPRNSKDGVINKGSRLNIPQKKAK